MLTLRAWRERFEEASERLEELGYDDRFRRTWQFYLAFSEAGFAEARIRDVQMLFAKPHWSGRPRLAADAAADRDASSPPSPDRPITSQAMERRRGIMFAVSRSW